LNDTTGGPPLVAAHAQFIIWISFQTRARYSIGHSQSWMQTWYKAAAYTMNTIPQRCEETLVQSVKS